MTIISPMPMTGFITCMIPSSCSMGIILANTAENAMPISRKLSTGVGSRLLIRNPMPADASSITTVAASELRGVFICRRILPVIKPVIIPISTGRNTRNSIMPADTPDVEICAETNATTRKNTSAPTRSSSAAMGISVFVTGPEVCIWLTMDSEGAGAVASAIPPNRNAR